MANLFSESSRSKTFVDFSAVDFCLLTNMEWKWYWTEAGSLLFAYVHVFHVFIKDVKICLLFTFSSRMSGTVFWSCDSHSAIFNFPMTFAAFTLPRLPVLGLLPAHLLYVFPLRYPNAERSTRSGA